MQAVLNKNAFRCIVTVPTNPEHIAHSDECVLLTSQARQYHEAVSEGRTNATGNRYSVEFLHSWERRVEVAFGGAAGLAYMHSHHVVHRDLTSSNLLIDQKGTSWMCKVRGCRGCKVGLCLTIHVFNTVTINRSHTRGGTMYCRRDRVNCPPACADCT